MVSLSKKTIKFHFATPTTQHEARLHKEFDEPAADTGVDNRLDFFVRTVGQIRQSPTRIGQYVDVFLEEKACKQRKSWRNLMNAQKSCSLRQHLSNGLNISIKSKSILCSVHYDNLVY